jgi:hypothetical protein
MHSNADRAAAVYTDAMDSCSAALRSLRSLRLASVQTVPGYRDLMMLDGGGECHQ